MGPSMFHDLKWGPDPKFMNHCFQMWTIYVQHLQRSDSEAESSYGLDSCNIKWVHFQFKGLAVSCNCAQNISVFSHAFRI